MAAAPFVTTATTTYEDWCCRHVVGHGAIGALVQEEVHIKMVGNEADPEGDDGKGSRAIKGR